MNHHQFKDDPFVAMVLVRMPSGTRIRDAVAIFPLHFS